MPEITIVKYKKKEDFSIAILEGGNDWLFLSRKGFSEKKAELYLSDYLNVNGVKEYSVSSFRLVKNKLVIDEHWENNKADEEKLNKINNSSFPEEKDFLLSIKANERKRLKYKESVSIFNYRTTLLSDLKLINDASVYFKKISDYNYLAQVSFINVLGEKEERIIEHFIKEREYSERDLYRDFLKKQILRFSNLLPKNYDILQDDHFSDIYEQFDEREKKVYTEMSGGKLNSVSKYDIEPPMFSDFIKKETNKKELLKEYKVNSNKQSESMTIYSDASISNFRSEKRSVKYGILFRAPKSDSILLEYHGIENNDHILSLIGNSSNLAELVGCLNGILLAKSKKYKGDLEIRCDNIIALAALNAVKDGNFNNLESIYDVIIPDKRNNGSIEEIEKVKKILSLYNAEKLISENKVNLKWVKGHKDDIFNKRVDYIASKFTNKESVIIFSNDDYFIEQKKNKLPKLKF